jgi:hypothetical protein
MEAVVPASRQLSNVEICLNVLKHMLKHVQTCWCQTPRSPTPQKKHPNNIMYLSSEEAVELYTQHHRLHFNNLWLTSHAPEPMNSSFDFSYSSIKLAFNQNQVAIHQALPRINSNENIVQCCPSKK